MPPEDRSGQALQAADEALEALEGGVEGASQYLMRAKKLARLMRDADAQKWLDYETRGYPAAFNFGELGACQRYAQQSGRIGPENKYYTQSLPEIEAAVAAEREAMTAFKLPSQFSPSVSSANPHEMAGITLDNTIKAFTRKVATEVAQHGELYRSWTKLLEGVKGAVHNYATDTHIALSFGDVAESLFDKARELVDMFVRDHCPKAAEQLVAVSDRVRDGNGESLSAALTSCRRLFASVADTVFPPQKDPYVGRDKKPRKVGQEEYKNRLLAFVDIHMSSTSTSAILSSQLDHLAARLDAVYEKACKGVHADITVDETRLTIIETYMFLAEIARIHSATIKVPT